MSALKKCWCCSCVLVGWRWYPGAETWQRIMYRLWLRKQYKRHFLISKANKKIASSLFPSLTRIHILVHMNIRIRAENSEKLLCVDRQILVARVNQEFLRRRYCRVFHANDGHFSWNEYRHIRIRVLRSPCTLWYPSKYSYSKWIGFFQMNAITILMTSWFEWRILGSYVENPQFYYLDHLEHKISRYI